MQRLNGAFMTNSLESIWEADLHRALGSMVPNGVWLADHYFAACPLHEDNEACFRYDRSIRAWHCEFGCGGGDLVALGVRLWQCGLEEAMDRVLALCGEEQRVVERRYPYLDAQGQFIYEVLRYSPKGFSTRIPMRWLWNDIVRGTIDYDFRQLYRLPEVLTADDVLIVEGEKDCETARTLGIVATCNAGGSSRWHSDYADFFRGKRVRIIADADESGRKHGRNIAGCLQPVAKSVQMIEFTEVKDLTEWIEAGGTVEDLEDIFRSVPPLEPKDVVGWWDPTRPVQLRCEAQFLFEAEPAVELAESEIEEVRDLQITS
jgi:5S rRNA maturation endonuclease (ribonuclease M5)